MLLAVFLKSNIMAYQHVIHYDPMKLSYFPYGEDSSENGYCGTLLAEEWDNSTNNKEEVSCKKCIRLFKNADEEMKSINESILNDMQSFVDFIDSNQHSQ